MSVSVSIIDVYKLLSDIQLYRLLMLKNYIGSSNKLLSNSSKKALGNFPFTFIAEQLKPSFN